MEESCDDIYRRWLDSEIHLQSYPTTDIPYINTILISEDVDPSDFNAFDLIEDYPDSFFEIEFIGYSHIAILLIRQEHPTEHKPTMELIDSGPLTGGL